MECPRCGYEIDDNALVCPNCKKVLKLICPVCRTVNTTNTCKKCGFPILVKCNNCGKINQNKNGKCIKCGFSTERSCILNEANSDTYVLMTIDLPNINEMKNFVGSKLINKFKANTDKIIKDTAKKAGCKVRLYKNTYVIRFLKEYTFNASASKAAQLTLSLLQEITNLNCRLEYKKNTIIRCDITLSKKDVKDNPNNIKSEFNIQLVNDKISNNDDKIRGAFQVITDASVYEALHNQYKFDQLDSILIDEKMVMFYEMNLRNNIELIDVEDEEDNSVQVPNFVQNMMLEMEKTENHRLGEDELEKDPDAIYDIQTLELEDVKCEFMRIYNADVFFHVINRLQSFPKGILAIRTDENYKPYTLKIINEIENLNLYKNIISVTCNEDMKYTPYSFFRELISAIFEYTVSQRLYINNDFSMFKTIDPDLIIRDLIELVDDGNKDIFKARGQYYDIFASILQAIPESLIFIEDFDKIDTSSLEVMRQVFASFESFNISFLVSYSKHFALHAKSNFLLSVPYYCEIMLKPSDFSKIIEDNKEFYREVIDSFYVQRIAKYACGSILYLDFAVQYLIESGVMEITNDNHLKIRQYETIIIPSSLNKLISRRLNLMKDNTDMLKFLASLMLLGTRIDEATIKTLGFEKSDEYIENLVSMGYIYDYNNCIYFPNYNILKQNLIDTVGKNGIKQVAQLLFDKVFTPEYPSPIKAELYNLMGDYISEFTEWENLAKVNLSLGDFYSYLNCAQKMLDLVNVKEYELVDNYEEYKNNLYNEITENLFEIIPDKTSTIAETTIHHLELINDTDKIIELGTKIIRSCLKDGNYSKSLEFMHKVLSLVPNVSLDPNNQYFDKNFFFMSMVQTIILFNVGAMKECLDLGYRLLEFINQETLPLIKPETLEEKDFLELIYDIVGFVAIANILMLNGNIEQFLTLVKNDLPELPASFEYFVIFEQLIHGTLTEIPEIEITETDRFSPALLYLIKAFAVDRENLKDYTTDIYRAKVSAKNRGLHAIEFICDLLIAEIYTRKEVYKKSEFIIYDVINECQRNGMTGIIFWGWYFMSNIYILQKKYDIAYGVINNSIIQMEKNNLHNEFSIMILNYNLYKIFMWKRDFQKAQLCIEQTLSIAKQYNINYNFDLEPSSYGININGKNVEIEDDNKGFLENLAEETEKNNSVDNKEVLSENNSAENNEEEIG